MSKLPKLVVAAAAALTGVLTSTAAPKAVGSSYDIDQNDSDNGCHILMAESDNILRGKTPTYIDSDHSWYNGGAFYETQTTDFGCVTDGKIPYHRNGGYGWDDRWESRALLPQDSKLEWTWETPEILANVRIFTQWPDGWRTDVSVKAIEVKIGENWTTLANSAFDFAHYANLNTVQPHQEGLHNRMVTFADENTALNLAQNVTGLRITFGNQSNDICYGCYWEIEAKRGEAVSFIVKNTVNGSTAYAGKGEVQVAVMPEDASCNLYQVTVNGAAPTDNAWLAYTAGTIPEDVIAFELPQTLDAATTFDLYLKGEATAAYKAGMATIKSAIGAEPTVGTKGEVTVILPNEVDGVTVTRDQILALNACEDAFGGIVSVEASDMTVDAENNKVAFTVTNLGGTSKTVEVPVNLIPSKGPLPQDYLKLMLHLGSVYATDDFKLSDKGKNDDYLAPFGGEAHQLAYAGQVYEGVETNDGCTTPGKLIWTPMKIDGDLWTEGNTRDYYVKYWQLYINSPTDRDITWHQKSDDAMWVWVNGELQSQNDYTDGYLNFDGHLRRGLNIITIKFYEQGGGDYMSIALRQRGGVGYFGDLTYQLNPDFMVKDAETDDFYKLTSSAVKVAFLPKVKGAAKYQIVQNNFMGTVQPAEDAWLDYVPGEWTTDPIPCTLSTESEAAYFTVFYQSAEGEVIEGPTASIKTGVACLGDVAAIGAVAASVGNGEYTLTFNESGSLQLAKDLTVDVLLVGGGGGGGTLLGGGGGGGGVVYRQGVTLKRGTYDVTVGEGGVGASWDGTVAAANGGNSVLSDFIAYGGGAGGGTSFTDGGFYNGSYEGMDGASGGGASGHRPLKAVNEYTVGQGLDGQGFDGGASIHNEDNPIKNENGAAGGGGGASEAGFPATQDEDGSNLMAGAGGAGRTVSITGQDVVYGGGGAGGSNGNRGALGGAGGGGSGGYNNGGTNKAEPGADGTDGLGGGGGGGGLFFSHYNSENSQTSHGGKGGRGTVIIRFRPTFAPDSKVGQGGEMTKVKVNNETWMVHKFTADGKFTIPNSVVGQVLLVGGGGGGGNGYGAAGGGGAGGMLVVDAAEIPAGNYEITVGQGGLGGIRGREDGANGGDSIFAGWKAVGGGGGAGLWNVHGFAGGSGGGAYSMTLMNNRGDYNGGAAVEGQGFPGGGSTLKNDNSDNFGPGGGGAGEAGASSSTEGPGKGGDGRMCDYSGEEVWYAGGGAGGGNANVNWYLRAEGGKGGGGFGGYWPNGGNADGDSVAGDGENGLGGGGGGGAMWGNGNLQGRGGNGGSGVVVIRYKLRPAGLMVIVK